MWLFLACGSACLVITGLGSTPKAFDHFLGSQDGAKSSSTNSGRMKGEQVPTLFFYGTVMDVSTARLVHGGKLSGDVGGGEPEPRRRPEAEAEPEPEAPAAEGEAAAAAEGAEGAAAADGAAADAAEGR